MNFKKYIMERLETKLNYVDKIAITEILQWYAYAKGKEKPSMKELKRIKKNLTLSKSEPPHPYIRFQKHSNF